MTRAAAAPWVVAVLTVALLVTPGPATAVVGDPVRVPTPTPDVRVSGGGWGHGVGMSQYGAYAQALRGWSATRILKHWYPGTNPSATADTSQPITVGLSTAARRPAVVVTEGRALWQVCDPSCRAVVDDDGVGVVGRADGTAWTVVADDDVLSLRRDGTVVWRGTTNATLKLPLSATAAERTVARVLDRRYRWGALEFGTHDDADCASPDLCVTVEVPTVERYLRGLAEMPAGWANAALAAQAIVGRTFAMRTLDDGERTSCRCHLLAAPSDQAYAGLDKEEGFAGDRWVAQVDATAGRVVRHGGALAATFYSSSHNRRSERIDDSFAFRATTATFPYLVSVDDPWSSDPTVANPYATWTETIDNGDFAEFVGEDLDVVTGITILSRTAGGTPRALAVTGLRDGEEVTVDFAGADGKPVAGGTVWIAGAEMRPRFGLRSQQIDRLGLAGFGDDDGNTHEYAIASLSAADVTQGCTATRFCPGADVTRAQTAALLARALRLPATADDAFTDDEGSVHEPDIDAVARAGVAKGCTADRFCPGDTLTRGQMASLLARALELPPADDDAFGDDDGTAHEDTINRLAAAGITNGLTPDRYGPGGTVTRAQMASFLTRALRSVG